MTDLTRQSPHYLVGRYIKGDLTGEESELLLSEITRDPKILSLLMKNVKADFWLADLISSERKALSVPDYMENSEVLLREVEQASEGSDLFKDILLYVQNAVPVHSDELKTNEEDPKTRLKYLFFGPKVSVPLSRRKPVFQKRNKRYDLPFIALSILFFGFLAMLSLNDFLSKKKQPVPFVTVPSVVQVVETVNAVWEKGNDSFKRGQRSGPNKFFLKSGLALLRFKSGAELILQGPTEFVVNSPTNGFCSLGQISANVPPEAVGFEVTTPFFNVIDRGTKFSLDVTPSQSKVSVHQGMVDIAQEKKPIHSLLVNKGVLINDLGTVKEYLPSPKDYFSLERFYKKLSVEVQEQVVRDLKREEWLNGHPNLLVHFNFAKSRSGSIQNEAKQAPSGSLSGIVRGGNVTEGSLWKSKALRLHSIRDSFQFQLDGTYDALTLFVRVRIDQIENISNVLIGCDALQSLQGSFLWQIARNGDSQFFLTQYKGLRRSFHAKRLLVPTVLGTWIDLAIVLDPKQKTINHYLDGKEIQSFPWKEPIPLTASAITVGNAPSESSRKDNKAGNRNINGAIEEILIFDRALSSENINKLSQRDNRQL